MRINFASYGQDTGSSAILDAVTEGLENITNTDDIELTDAELEKLKEQKEKEKEEDEKRKKKEARYLQKNDKLLERSDKNKYVTVTNVHKEKDKKNKEKIAVTIKYSDGSEKIKKFDPDKEVTMFASLASNSLNDLMKVLVNLLPDDFIRENNAGRLTAGFYKAILNRQQGK